MDKIIRLLTVIACAAAASAAYPAEKFPSRPVRLIVPYAPGGATDITARLLQIGISELWGQPVIVDNRAGASGNIALELAARAAPDGYTLQVGNVSTNAINETTFASLKIKPSRDLTGVTNLIQLPHLWTVSTAVPVSSLKELVDYAKKSAGRMNYASAGVGSYPHLDAVKFLKHVGVEMTHVPYKGGAGQMIPAIMGNEVQFMFINMASSLPNIRAGRIKAARHHLADAAARAAQRPDRRRGGLSRLRYQRLERAVRSGRHPEAAAQADPRRHLEGDGKSGDEGCPRPRHLCPPWSTLLRRSSRSSCSRRSRPGARSSSRTTSRSNEKRVPRFS